MSANALDRSALDRLQRIGGDALVAAMLESFLANAAARVSDAIRAAAKGDGAALSASAHALKSSAGNVGALLLMARAAQAEREAGQSDVDLIELAAGMSTSFDEARSAVDAFRAGQS